MPQAMFIKSFASTAAQLLLITLVGTLLVACGGVAATPPALTDALATITVGPTNVPATSTVVPTSVPATSTAAPTSVPATSTVAPTIEATEATVSAVTIDPCELLMPQEASVFFGEIQGESSQGVTSGGRECTFYMEKADLFVRAYNGGDGKAEIVVAEFDREGLSMEPLPGFGDSAFFGSTDDRARMIIVEGDAVVALGLQNKEGPMEHAAVLLKGLTASAASRLEDVAVVADALPAALPENVAEPTGVAAGDDPCGLLAAADVEGLIGTLMEAPSSEGFTQNGVSACLYGSDTAMVTVSSYRGDAAKLEERVAEVKAKGAPIEPAAGLGDLAYIAAAHPEGMPNEKAVAGILVALQGDTIIELTLFGELSETETADVLQALATEAITGL